MRSAGAEAVAMATTMKRHKPVGWVDQPPAKGKRFKGFVNAKALLGEGPHGPWISDRDAPSGNGWRRYISKDNTSGEFTRARIVANKGICLICVPLFALPVHTVSLSSAAECLGFYILQLEAEEEQVTEDDEGGEEDEEEEGGAPNTILA